MTVEIQMIIMGPICHVHDGITIWCTWSNFPNVTSKSAKISSSTLFSNHSTAHVLRKLLLDYVTKFK